MIILFLKNLLYPSWDSTKEVLEKKMVHFMKRWKIYLKSTVYGDDSDRVVVRDNGIPTYLVGDIFIIKINLIDHLINI